MCIRDRTHPARLAIVDVLRRDEACVCHLEAVLGQRQAFISQHLMILRDAGIVQDRRVASNVFYRIADRRAVKVLDAVAPERRSTLTVPHASCPCPKCTPAHSDSKPAIQRSGSAARR